MTKFDTIEKYTNEADRLMLPEKALLSTWECLGDFHDDIVLVGGLAVQYLTKPLPDGRPGSLTLDLDYGISIVADNRQYGSVRDMLGAKGFTWTEGRFSRTHENITLYIDLLTDDGSSTESVVGVDGLGVSSFPGLGRALICNRFCSITGPDLIGVERTACIRVAEVGPMMVLKLNAFASHRRGHSGKDVHDLLCLGTDYLDGSEAAVAGFKEEVAQDNRGIAAAMECLKQHFSDVNALGPMACAAFRLNNFHEAPENNESSKRIRQNCVTLAYELLGE